MTTGATSSFGTYLKLGDGGTAEVFATIAEVKDIKGPKLSLNTEDVTSHDSTDGWAEYIGTILEAGEVTFDINWKPANVTHSFSAGVLKDLVGRGKRNFQLVVPVTPALTWSFAALVTEFGPEFKVKGALTSSVKLQVSGKPTLA